MEYLASRLDDAGIAYQAPVGGHGVFVDAAAMFPQIPYYEFPGQVLAVELYKEAGIRTCDIGSYMLGNDPDTNDSFMPILNSHVWPFRAGSTPRPILI